MTQAALERTSEALSRRDAKLADAEHRLAELAAAHCGAADALAEREADLVTMRQEAARMREQLQVRALGCPGSTAGVVDEHGVRPSALMLCYVLNDPLHARALIEVMPETLVFAAPAVMRARSQVVC